MGIATSNGNRPVRILRAEHDPFNCLTSPLRQAQQKAHLLALHILRVSFCGRTASLRLTNRPTDRSSRCSLVQQNNSMTARLPELIAAAMASHFLAVFYAKQFQWKDLLLPVQGLRMYGDFTTSVKAIVCCWLVYRCQLGHISSQVGAFASVALAIPQLVRWKGRKHQQIRSVLGPVAPILAANNAINGASYATSASAFLSALAFVILRPDNTAVLDLLLKWLQSRPTEEDTCAIVAYLHNTKNRRKTHGILAACHTGFAAITFLENFLVKK